MEDDGERFDCTVCALDADSVGCPDRIRAAVRGLQADGLNVILVSQRDLAPFLDGAEAIDTARLLHSRAINETALDLIKVAEDYRCLFMTNVDLNLLERDWRVPPHRQTWLQCARESLHLKFTFGSNNTFAVNYGMRACRAQKNVIAPDRSYSRDPRSTRSIAGRTRGGPHTDQEIPGSTGTAAWLGGLEPEPSSFPASMPSPPPKPQKTFTEYNLAGVRDEIDLGGWPRLDAEPAAISVTLQRDGMTEEVLCVLCQDKGSWLFPCAVDLANAVLPYELNESEEPNTELESALRAYGPDWAYHLFLVVTLVDGPYAGLRAIGLGSNSRARKRAARVAIAATVRTHFPVLENLEDPNGTGDFLTFMQRACQLLGKGCLYGGPELPPQRCILSSVPRTCDDDQPPPPPPPGPAPSVASPPPPPPPVQTAAVQSARKWKGGHQLASAITSYSPGGQGYLDLQPGDIIEITGNRERGDADDHLYYLFGQCKERGAQGWFPEDMVHIH